MQAAVSVSEAIFGHLNVITAKAKLKLALALCLDPERKDSGLALMAHVEKLFHQIAAEMSSPDQHDMLFNNLFEFQMTLHDFHQQQNSASQSTLNSLEEEAKATKNNVLQKKAHVLIQKCF